MPPKKKKVELTEEERERQEIARQNYLAQKAENDRAIIDSHLQRALQEPRQAAFDVFINFRNLQTSNKDPEFFDKIAPVVKAYMDAQIITAEHYKKFAEYYPQLPIKAQSLPTE